LRPLSFASLRRSCAAITKTLRLDIRVSGDVEMVRAEVCQPLPIANAERPEHRFMLALCIAKVPGFDNRV
jgi:hypothetical protein